MCPLRRHSSQTPQQFCPACLYIYGGRVVRLRALLAWVNDESPPHVSLGARRSLCLSWLREFSRSHLLRHGSNPRGRRGGLGTRDRASTAPYPVSSVADEPPRRDGIVTCPTAAPPPSQWHYRRGEGACNVSTLRTAGIFISSLRLGRVLRSNGASRTRSPVLAESSIAARMRTSQSPSSPNGSGSLSRAMHSEK